MIAFLYSARMRNATLAYIIAFIINSAYFLMEFRIWLVGGTTESVDLAQNLVHCQFPCVITVVSPSAQHCYPQSPSIQVHTEALNAGTIELFIRNQQVQGILDASHPYATEISKLAMMAAQTFHLPYLRFERSQVSAAGSGQNTLLLEVETLSQLLCDEYLLKKRVLLTIGRKSLQHFRDWHLNSTLFARILPYPDALQAALDAGFSCDRIIALRPPISFELEKALWQQWQISLVVTKASGQPGGEHIKRQVAQDLGVTLVVIKRPPLTYPQQTDDLQTALRFCQTALYRKQTRDP